MHSGGSRGVVIIIIIIKGIYIAQVRKGHKCANGSGAGRRERGGTPFRQIFWSRNGAPANIVGLATGGTLTLKRSGKSRHTR